MTFDEYQKLALRTYKGPQEAGHMLTNGALGLAGEAGEVADLLKKSLYPSKVGDGANLHNALVDELGDVLWYVALVSQALGVPMEELAARNIAKLASRHNVAPGTATT